MGLLSSRYRKEPLDIHALPSGCITIDRNGAVIASTLSQSVQPAKIQHIAGMVFRALQGARGASLSLTEIQVDYPALKIVARELKGGAIVFLTPRNLAKQ
jgi:hypothetical protein